MVVESVLVTGGSPSQVAERVRAIWRSSPVAFSGAVEVGAGGKAGVPAGVSCADLEGIGAVGEGGSGEGVGLGSFVEDTIGGDGILPGAAVDAVLDAGDAGEGKGGPGVGRGA